MRPLHCRARRRSRKVTNHLIHIFQRHCIGVVDVRHIWQLWIFLHALSYGLDSTTRFFREACGNWTVRTFRFERYTALLMPFVKLFEMNGMVSVVLESSWRACRFAFVVAFFFLKSLLYTWSAFRIALSSTSCLKVWFEHTPSYVVMLLIIVAFFNLRFFSNSKWLRSAENELCQDIHFLNRFNETILFQTLSGIKSACPLI